MLGKRLKELRGKRTQQEVADLLGISRARYSHYENEHVQPDNDMLQKMADLHNVQVDYLLGRDVQINPKTSLSEKQADHVLKRMIEHYNIDVSDPDTVKKLEQIIQLVFPPSK